LALPCAAGLWWLRSEWYPVAGGQRLPWSAARMTGRCD
jgi:hypothetical protein